MGNSIVFVTGAMCRGGAERVISILANDYVSRGWQVTIAMLLHHDTDGYYLDPKIRVADLSQPGVKAMIAIPIVAMRLRRLIKESQPEAVVSFMAQISVVSGLACSGLPVRLIASERIDPAMVHRGFLYRSVLYHFYAKCSCLILQTKRAWSFFPDRIRKNSVIIPNPIQVSDSVAEHWKKKIVTAGRLETQKNHAMLIRAFNDFHQDYPDYILEIFGDGTKGDELRKQIHILGLDDCVHLRGSSSTLHKDISDAAMFVLSSDYEGLSNALLEAMMMGLPVISTDCAGADEAINKGINGDLVPVGDAAALANAMKIMAADETRMRQMGKQAQADAVARYDVARVLSLWINVIEASAKTTG